MATISIHRLQLEVLFRSGAIDAAESQEVTNTERRWPAFLPGPQLDDLQVSRQDNGFRTQTDTGPGKVRPRFTTTSQYVKVMWLFSDAQLAVFEAFYRDALSGGSEYMWWPHPLKTPPLNDLIVAGTEIPYTNRHLFLYCRFKAPYDKKRVSLDRFQETRQEDKSLRVESVWQVTAELEIRPDVDLKMLK